jgi:hypothetical protein
MLPGESDQWQEIGTYPWPFNGGKIVTVTFTTKIKWRNGNKNCNKKLSKNDNNTLKHKKKIENDT